MSPKHPIKATPKKKKQVNLNQDSISAPAWPSYTGRLNSWERVRVGG